MATGLATRSVQQRISRIIDMNDNFHGTVSTISDFEKIPLVPLDIAIEPLTSLLPNIENYAVHAIEQCKNPPADGLTKDMSGAIRLYSMEEQFRGEPLYAILNSLLRTENKQQLEPWLFYLKLLKTALSQLPSMRQVIYRGVKLDLSNDYSTAKKVKWPSFSSCTGSITVLQSEQFCGMTSPRTMFAIECCSGRNIRNHSHYPSEEEILLLPGTELEVTGFLKLADNIHMIQLKEIEAARLPSSLLPPRDFIKPNWDDFTNSVYNLSPSNSYSEIETNPPELSTSCPCFESSSIIFNEIFEQYIGDIQIEDKGNVASHGTSINGGEVRGKNEYTSGKHRLRFKIEKSSTWIFIGIISKTTPMKENSYKSLTSYGWVSQDHSYAGGWARKKNDIFSTYNNLLENDVIELVIDVTTQTLHYTNQRMNKPQEMTVDINKCPLPWQILINLSGYNDRIRLISYTNLL
ncbi:unnamed protein product [Rotaria sp. Silwood1]|nr:unnamed protein product [Rotaria sp. Silwood1]CAF3872960.1 unnamed protein product [Rotaria sp. Silwood1]CAF4812869.1 unnamed protein product [Rotaria sp. Silwood1]CAF4932024.1 unnamed protein product [Rotaria sp. Silwood1]